MDYKAKLTAEMKRCMKAGEKSRLLVVRTLLAAIKQQEVDQQTTLNDEQILAVLDKASKQRKESIAQFEVAGRADLVENEASELAVIQEFMPQPLSDNEVAAMIEQAFSEVEPSGMQDMGKVMAVLKPLMQGRADMASVSKQIKAKLG
ncbi:GatB/YqeY domain-containing protein [Thiomicrospira sp. ALE5]|uniref:GatB/YqeY domain-containing protein n=1 Tax=Thiomicrospira sp. ALE5 TaxID=748650 RepID=UPI0008ED45D2|nr:GatB/YqeY domain-containing protein [Thiomicrospira sp. ALE5]SFR60974.1 hypothetical protein SAMN03092900_1691 [Thiomicrospira sp. ALE5]